MTIVFLSKDPSAADNPSISFMAVEVMWWRWRGGRGRGYISIPSAPEPCHHQRHNTSAPPLTNAAEVFEIILCSFFFLSLLLLYSFSVRFLFSCKRPIYQKKKKKNQNNRFYAKQFLWLKHYAPHPRKHKYTRRKV